VLILRLLLGIACSPLSFKKIKAFVVGLNSPNQFVEGSVLWFPKLLGPVKKLRCVDFLIELSVVGINSFGGSKATNMLHARFELQKTSSLVAAFGILSFMLPVSLLDFLHGGFPDHTLSKGPLLSCHPTLHLVKWL